MSALQADHRYARSKTVRRHTLHHRTLSSFRHLIQLHRQPAQATSAAPQMGGNQVLLLLSRPEPSPPRSIARQAKSTQRMKERMRTMNISSGTWVFCDPESALGADCSV